MAHLLKFRFFSDKLVNRLEATAVFTEEFDSYYVIRIMESGGDRYFFSTRTFVNDIGLAKKFNTLRSARRSVKLLDNSDCKVEKLKRNNF